MRKSRLWMTLVLAIAAAGCGGSVPLLTRSEGYCYLSNVQGELVTDQAAGTAIIEKSRGNPDRRIPISWPKGYTGRQSFSDVEVLDGSGNVVVRTGTRVYIGGGYGNDAWEACGSINPARTLP